MPKIKSSYVGFYTEKYHKPVGEIKEKIYDFLYYWYERADYRYSSKHYLSKGLCQALKSYLDDSDYDFRIIGYDAYLNELKRMFIEDGLDPVIPFNNSLEEFYAERDCSKNKKRMKWVREKILERFDRLP